MVSNVQGECRAPIQNLFDKFQDDSIWSQERELLIIQPLGDWKGDTLALTTCCLLHCVWLVTLYLLFERKHSILLSYTLICSVPDRQQVPGEGEAIQVYWAFPCSGKMVARMVDTGDLCLILGTVLKHPISPVSFLVQPLYFELGTFCFIYFFMSVFGAIMPTEVCHTWGTMLLWIAIIPLAKVTRVSALVTCIYFSFVHYLRWTIWPAFGRDVQKRQSQRRCSFPIWKRDPQYVSNGCNRFCLTPRTVWTLGRARDLKKCFDKMA